MAHPHDLSCQWCGAEMGRIVDTATGWRLEHLDHACPNKPPLTPEEGAAALGGMLAMAFAIRDTHLSPSLYGHPSAWVCPHDPKCALFGCDCGPECVCGSI